jgi:hypothetical protein
LTAKNQQPDSKNLNRPLHAGNNKLLCIATGAGTQKKNDIKELKDCGYAGVTTRGLAVFPKHYYSVGGVQ